MKTRSLAAAFLFPFVIATPLTAQAQAGMEPRNDSEALSSRLAPTPPPPALMTRAHPMPLGVLVGEGAAAKQDAARVRWERELQAAQSRRRSGITYAYVGGGIAVASAVVGAATANLPIYTLGGLAGVGIGLYGLYVWVSANDRVAELELEGRMQGYIR